MFNACQPGLTTDWVLRITGIWAGPAWDTMKRGLFESFLAQVPVVRVVAITEACDLPQSVRAEPLIGLDLGLNLPTPIPDLAVDDKGFRATLSFGGRSHAVAVPWHAVLTMGDPEGQRGAIFGQPRISDEGESPWPSSSPIQEQPKVSEPDAPSNVIPIGRARG